MKPMYRSRPDARLVETHWRPLSLRIWQLRRAALEALSCRSIASMTPSHQPPWLKQARALRRSNRPSVTSSLNDNQGLRMDWADQMRPDKLFMWRGANRCLTARNLIRRGSRFTYRSPCVGRRRSGAPRPYRLRRPWLRHDLAFGNTSV
jgi:hypothetical protein